VLTLPPEVFASVVNALADTLIRDYRERWSRGGPEPNTMPTPSAVAVSPTWLKMADAAKRSQCSEGTLRREVRAGRLRAVRVGGRKSVRFRAEWVDDWLQAAGTVK
jgi:excisionase family DNA binding protein